MKVERACSRWNLNMSHDKLLSLCIFMRLLMRLSAIINNSDGRLNVNVTRHIMHIQSIIDEVLRQD